VTCAVGDIPQESNYTKPRPHCPHPERWHAYDCDATEAEVVELVAAFVRALQPDVVIETGTHLGYMAQAIGEALQRNGQGVLLTMEPDPARCDVSQRRCEGLPVVVLQRESLSITHDEVRDLTGGGTVGFAWFDSLVPLRVSEFEHFRPLMDERTVVGFHDTAPQHGRWSHTVRTHPGLSVFDLPTPRGCLLGRVKE
jgi:hypothetical protein